MEYLTIKDFLKYGFSKTELEILTRNNFFEHDWSKIEKIGGDIDGIFNHYNICKKAIWKFDKNNFPTYSKLKTEFGFIEYHYKFSKKGNLLLIETKYDTYKFEYDKNDNLLRSFCNDKLEKENEYDKNGNLIVYRNHIDLIYEKYTYNKENKLILKEDINNNIVTSLDYIEENGVNIILCIDSKGDIQKEYYDNHENVSMIEKNGVPIFIRHFCFDKEDRLVAICDENFDYIFELIYKGEDEIWKK